MSENDIYFIIARLSAAEGPVIPPKIHNCLHKLLSDLSHFHSNKNYKTFPPEK